mmetsp:Transcript_11861/g.10478  ORF Transcript_11861/g.10478 Transcript_11861/m.10478 type:complete len:238 (-) Transcript_11861:54-767(-)|eukprot:CAMPEP_0205807442 /NCGR_PEP_ID=MMETSP0205-20121125/11168_1 /ASSEMBLY_ACC=CAM_ASM_000278 /TAXON_ID=36767 /ORGANISM="Euplotes focardii, Strain TN1" /LENGTH=237 /DNA_ID=CAMNT_0053081669 /DNA_START=8 /DNA_END=721 /DNA_ORIENTATION=+
MGNQCNCTTYIPDDANNVLIRKSPKKISNKRGKTITEKPEDCFEDSDEINRRVKFNFDKESEEDPEGGEVVPSHSGDLLDLESKRIVMKGKKISTAFKKFDIELAHLSKNARKKLKKLQLHNFKELSKHRKENKLREVRLTSITADGSKYIGEFRSKTYVKDGVGYLINPDGSIFEGTFEDDIPTIGRFIQTNGKVLNGLDSRISISKMIINPSETEVTDKENIIVNDNTAASDKDQ